MNPEMQSSGKPPAVPDNAGLFESVRALSQQAKIPEEAASDPVPVALSSLSAAVAAQEPLAAPEQESHTAETRSSGGAVARKRCAVRSSRWRRRFAWPS